MVAIATFFLCIGCGGERAPSSSAEGYLISTDDLFAPREVFVVFREGVEPTEAEAILRALGSDVISSLPSRLAYTVMIALGQTLQEGIDRLNEEVSVWYALPGLGETPLAYSRLALCGADGTITHWVLGEEVDAAVQWAWRYRVRVHGTPRWSDEADRPGLDAWWIEVLGERVVSKEGSLTLVTREDGTTVIILEDGEGKAWDLDGPDAAILAALPNAEGLRVQIDGLESRSTLASRAGGLILTVKAYTLIED